MTARPKKPPGDPRPPRPSFGVVRSLPFDGDEASLVAAMAVGRLDAGAAFYDRHVQSIHAIVFRLLGPDGEIDDVVHDVFVRALDGRRTASRSQKPGANGSGLGSNPDLSAAIYRHVGAVAGTFAASGKLMNQKLWADSTTFYTAAPADYYAAFWHAHALGKKAYGFPYDDMGGYSSFISHSKPQYMLVAIGW